MTSRPSTAAPILAVLAVVLVTLGAYVGAYLGIGKSGFGVVSETGERFIVREFQYSWQAKTFRPAGHVEGWLRRIEVVIRGPREFRRRIPVDAPIQPISDEELDWIVEQWAGSEGVDVTEEWDAISQKSQKTHDEAP